MLYFSALLTVIVTVSIFVASGSQAASMAATVGAIGTIALWYAQDSWAYWKLQVDGKGGCPHLPKIGASHKGIGHPPLLAGVVWIDPMLNGVEVFITLPLGGAPIHLGAYAHEKQAIAAAKRYVFGKGITDWHAYAHHPECKGRLGFCIAIRSDAATFVLVDPRTGEYWDDVAYQAQQNLLRLPTAEPEMMRFSAFGDLSLSPDF